MNSKMAFKYRQELVVKSYEIYRLAKTFCQSSEEVIKSRDELIYGHKMWEKLPRHTKAYIQGCLDCLYENHWQEVEWVFPWKGQIYTNWNNLPTDGKLYYMKINTGLHVYRTDRTKHYTGSADQYNAGLEDGDEMPQVQK